MNRYINLLSYLFRLTRRLTPFRVWNLLLLRISYLIARFFRHNVHWGKPWTVSIEPTTACNLNCPECPSGLKSLHRPTGHIDSGDYGKWLDALLPELFYLILYFQGEPLLHRDFFELVRLARRKKIFTATSTNGHFLQGDAAGEVVSSGLDEMIISLDGTDASTYMHYRKGGDFEKVLDGIRNLAEARRAAGSSHPYIRLQFIVMKHNQHQIRDIRRLGRALGVDRVELKTAQINDPFDKGNLLTDLAPYARYKKDLQGKLELQHVPKRGCMRMWQAAVITWDGRVLPCCYDKDATHSFGKLEAGHTFEDIWAGEGAFDFRKQVMDSRQKFSICRNCFEK